MTLQEVEDLPRWVWWVAGFLWANIGLGVAGFLLERDSKDIKEEDKGCAAVFLLFLSLVFWPGLLLSEGLGRLYKSLKDKEEKE